VSYTFGKENTLFVVDALVDSLCRLGVGGKLLKFTRAPKYLNVLNVPSSYVPPNSQNLRFLALLLKKCRLFLLGIAHKSQIHISLSFYPGPMPGHLDLFR